MEAIEPDEVELMEELLDDIMEEHGPPEIKKLKHAIKTTTASTVEPTTETVADVSPTDDAATPTTTSSTQMVDSTTAEPTTVDSTTAEPTTVTTTSMTTTQNIDPGSADEVILT
ncbi:integumentary mucin C.1-like [Ostrinia nubilalis]|uniref:integumentary mucin C.1-like n=1 Tax=Ostrinia nubilalis TaxID=29057 RepID=UPI003082376E